MQKQPSNGPFGAPLTCLSVKQPWAGLIASGVKTLEIRSWSTPYRGPLLIASSLRSDEKGHQGPFGCALCLVELVDVIPWARTRDNVRRSCIGHWFPGQWAWVLAGARQVDHFPVKGRLGLYRVNFSA